MFAAPQGAGYPVHKHGDAAFIFSWQAEGRKTWELVAPGAEVEQLLEPVREIGGVPMAEWSLYDPVFRVYPTEIAHAVDVYVAELEPGDLLVVPVGWIHRVQNHADSVGVGFVLGASRAQEALRTPWGL